MAGAESKAIPLVALNSGHAMPVLGMGTSSMAKPPDLAAVLVHAMASGYRHFDTASLYGTEEALGAAIAEAIRAGVVASRDELFVTSKLWPTDADPALVLPSLKKSLLNLGLEYLDLYLIHWPIRMKPGEPKVPFAKEDLLPFDMEGTWRSMEECQKLGLVKSIGVSNFSSTKLSKLLSHATIPPAVNQVEMHVCWNQKKLREMCREKGIQVTAWSPLGSYGSPWGCNSVMESSTLKEIASAKGKTVAQVALRWLYEQGVCFVVKSFSKERMKENLQIFDWELSSDEASMIEQIPQRRGYRGEEFVAPNGPYRSLDELWDGEI